MLDDDTKDQKPIPIIGDTNAEVFRSAIKYNAEGFGIFWTVQKFKTHNIRRMDHLDKILSWAVDIDIGLKSDQSKLIAKYPEPSMVVESKRGFHIYYNAVDAVPDNYKIIQNEYLIPAFGGDDNAKDLSRILRVPNFYHLKNANDPYLVKLVFESKAKYTEDQIKKFFKPKEKNKEYKEKTNLRRILKFQSDQGLFERIWSMDCEYALSVLSGTDAVGGEVYTFHRVSRGNLNIRVNGKSSSCFIDSEKKIGSSDGGGPTVWQWLFWFHKDHKVVYKLMKQYFPEVFK